MYCAKSRVFGYKPKTLTVYLDKKKAPSYSFSVGATIFWNLEHYMLFMKASKMGENQVRQEELSRVEIHGTEENWLKFRVKALKLGLYREFSQNKELIEQLFSTKDDELIVRTEENCVWALEPGLVPLGGSEQRAFNWFSCVLMELRELFQLQKEISYNLQGMAGLRTELIEVAIGKGTLYKPEEWAVRSWLNKYKERHDFLLALVDLFVDNWPSLEQLTDLGWMKGFRAMRWNCLIRAVKEINRSAETQGILEDIKTEDSFNVKQALIGIDSLEPVVWLDALFIALDEYSSWKAGISSLAKEWNVPEKLFHQLLEKVLDESIDSDVLLEGLSLARVFRLAYQWDSFAPKDNATAEKLKSWLQSHGLLEEEAIIVVGFLSKFVTFRKGLVGVVSTAKGEVKNLWGFQYSGKSLEEFVQVGDLLNSEMLHKFVYPTVLVPHGKYAQGGERIDKKYDEKEGEYKGSYKTFEKVSEGIWKYLGVYFEDALPQE